MTMIQRSPKVRIGGRYRGFRSETTKQRLVHNGPRFGRVFDLPRTRLALQAVARMNILGISAFFHDSAACLVVDGSVVAAAQEERFTRKKHDASFPQHAIDYCLQARGLTPQDLDYVAYYDKPLQKFDRLLETYLATAPRGFSLFRTSVVPWLREKLYIPRTLHRGLGRTFRGPYVFLQHHESHAASAFFPSPFQDAAIVTIDGVGEWSTVTVGRGVGNRIELLEELRFPHSLGLLYSTLTYLAGFRVNSGEYKLMGLAPYGEPIYAETILRELVDLRPDGSFRLNMKYFGFTTSDRMASPELERLFGPARAPESELTRREMDLAASIQAVTETIVLRIAAHAYQLTGCDRLCMAGGVALNCVANGRLLREGPFKALWIQPAAGDAGGALGAAMFTWHQLLDHSRVVGKTDAQHASLLGPASDNLTIRRMLDHVGAAYRYLEEDQLVDTVADLLASQMVVAHAAGRMEFGPRALGNRSILGDPRSPTMQATMNQKIKFRESFRPFAPIVLKEEASKHFDLDEGVESPYMLIVAPVRSYSPMHEAFSRPTHRVDSSLPAITHVDGSARVQTVDEAQNPRVAGILRRFKARTGIGVLVNTSFNIRGEPIVCTPRDAYRCFMATQIDVLVLGNYVLLKTEQPVPPSEDADTYRSQFALD